MERISPKLKMVDKKKMVDKIADPWSMQGLGVPTPCTHIDSPKLNY